MYGLKTDSGCWISDGETDSGWISDGEWGELISKLDGLGGEAERQIWNAT